MFSALAAEMATGPVTWSARVERLDDRAGESLLAVGDEQVLPTASIGKILLLLTVARDIEAARLDPEQPLPVHPDDRVADSGMLQHLTRRDLPVLDHAVLVGAVSDNLATNVLLRAVGLDAVHEVTADIGLRAAALHDQVRDGRGPEHPPFLSTAHAADLVRLVTGLHRGDLVSPAASARVVQWLRLDTDTSMVAGAFGLDPLCHWEADRGIELWHKTGTNVGTRADCGVVVGPAATVAYACVARWPGDDITDPLREPVLATMSQVGAAIRGVVE